MRNSKLIPGWVHVLIIMAMMFAGIRIKDWFVDANRDFRPALPKDVATLLMGDSHTVKLLDPTAFDKALNLGMSSEFVYYSYFKLQLFLEQGVRPEQVILSLSYHSLATFPFLAEAEMNRRYHLLVNAEFYRRKFAHEDIHQSTLARYLGNEWVLPIQLGQDIAEFHELRSGEANIPWLGAYEPKEGSIIGKRRSLKAALRRHYSKFGLPTGVSEAKLAYLRDFAKLCQDKGIELWLVNTPVHEDYFKGIPPAFITATDKAARDMERYGARYLNLSRELFEDTEFYDYDHLNTRGSQRFSRLLNSLIKLRSETGEMADRGIEN